MHSRLTSVHAAVASLIDACRLYGRWWVARGWTSPRVWRRVVIGVAVLAVLLTGVRRPLAEWWWPDSQVQQLFEQGQQALREGRLTAADGSGARELLQAAAALDADRGDVRAALAATGQQALAQAAAALADGRQDEVAPLLELARQLQVPQTQLAPLEQQLQRWRSGGAEVEPLLRRAMLALQAGRLEGDADAALPLLQQVLVLQPAHMAALEAREDALSDLLLDSQRAARQGDVSLASAILAKVKQYDAGHFALPEAQAALSGAIEQRRQQAQRELKRGQLTRALAGFDALLAVDSGDAASQAGRAEVARRYAAEAQRLAADFQFADAQRVLQQAKDIAPDAGEVRQAAETLARTRQAQQAMQSALGPRQREQRVQALMTQIEQAEAKGQWLVPPGRSVYDLLMAAQALMPRDARLEAVAVRLLDAVRRCTEDNLRANRVRAARGCHDAWQVLAPLDPLLPAARTRLAQRWLAVGTERLGRGDVVFAREAVAQARELGADGSELSALRVRVDGVPEPR